MTPAAALALALALGSLLLYAPSVGFDFLSWDDYRFVLDAPGVRGGLDPSGLRRVFGEIHVTPPVTQISHMLDVELFGLDPSGHHATNAVLHALNAVLLFALLFQLTDRLLPSAFAAAVFAVHPLNVESVAWVSERKNLLAGAFGLLTIHAYAAWTRQGGVLRYSAMLLLLALGLASKATLVTLPCVFLLLDFWPLQRLDGANWAPRMVEKLPLFGLSLAACGLTWVAQDQAGALQTWEQLPLGARLANAVGGYAVYLRQLVWPVDLAPFYPQPALVGGPLWSPARFTGAAALLTAISGVAWFGRRRWPFLAVGWCWFLGVMLPTSGVVQVGEQAVADRYMYLPMIGLLIGVAWGGAVVARARPAWRPGLAVGALLAVAAFSGITSIQLLHWRGTLPLFERALAVTEDNYVAQNNVAWILATCPDPTLRDGARAVMLAERAVALNDGRDADYLDTLAAAYAEAGRFDEAVATSRKAIALASEMGRKGSARSFRRRLARFEKGQPERHSRGCPRI